MKVKKILPIVLAVLSVILVATLILTTMFSRPDDNVICEGVSVNGIEVGGMTPDEAAEVIADYVKNIQDKSIAIEIDDQVVTTTLGELGYSCNLEESVEEAMSLGKDGNFLNRYRESKEIAEKGEAINLVASLDKDILRQFVEENCTQFDVEPVNASLTRENGRFIVIEHKSGRKVSVQDTVDLIESCILAQDCTTTEKIEIAAVVEVAEPEYTTEMTSLCKDVLGTFTTSYTSSSASRSGNVANGARLINGSVVWPGETFSAGGTMNPITAANGYYMAGAYENGQVVESIGGGVCQVSTTLYNAALMAELEITERSNHSMIVSYVKPSMDSAIAGTYKDLKITNNTDAPIYIEGVTANKHITFTIYGHETRPANRTIKYESEVLEVIQPGAEKVTKDPTQPTTYRKVTQSAHVGYKAQLWKIVYEDGKQVSREKVNYSSYAAEPAYVTVGTKEAEEEEVKEEVAAPETAPEADVNENNTENKNENKEENKKPVTETPEVAPEAAPEENHTSEESSKENGTNDTEQGGTVDTEKDTETSEEDAVG